MSNATERELDQLLEARFREEFDGLVVETPDFAVDRRRRAKRGWRVPVAVAGIALVGAPAAAVGVHQLLVDDAFSDMGVPRTDGEGRTAHHLVSTTRVSPDLEVRVFVADTPGSTDGKSGSCLFAETVTDDRPTGGKGVCLTPSPGSGVGVLRTRTYLLVHVPDGVDGTLRVRQGDGYDRTEDLVEGYAVLAPAGAGPLDLSYEVAGIDEHVVVEAG